MMETLALWLACCYNADAKLWVAVLLWHWSCTVHLGYSCQHGWALVVLRICLLQHDMVFTASSGIMYSYVITTLCMHQLKGAITPVQEEEPVTMHLVAVPAVI